MFILHLVVEKKKYPDSTYAILAYKNFGNRFNYDTAVDWAVNMVANGFETESLLILASLSKPTGYFETHKYMITAVEELNLKLLSGYLSTVAEVWENVKEIATANDIFTNLYTIHTAVVAMDEFSEFGKIYYAWDAFQEGEHSLDLYWSGANRYNLEQLSIAYTQRWLNEHKLKIERATNMKIGT